MSFGICFMLAVALCILVNAIVIILLLKKKNEVNYLDLILVSLALSDALQAAVGDSIEIHAFISGKELVGTPCVISAFSTTFLGLVSIAHLAGIAVMKHVILKVMPIIYFYCSKTDMSVTSAIKIQKVYPL